MKTHFSILLILLAIGSAILGPDCKNIRKTTYDSFACVCTEAQPCDKIERPVKTDAGVITKWRSSKDGARFRKSSRFYGFNTPQGIQQFAIYLGNFQLDQIYLRHKWYVTYKS